MNDKQRLILRTLCVVAGDKKYSEMLEDVRRLGIWSQARVFCEIKATQGRGNASLVPYSEMSAIMAKYPNERTMLAAYSLACEERFKKDLEDGCFRGDGTGELYIRACLKTFGRELP